MMSGSEIMLAGRALGWIKLGYDGIQNARLDARLKRIEQEGITKEELINSDHRFAQFMRYIRAAEVCSSNKMLDCLTECLINGVRSGKADTNSDLFQIVLTRLGSLTETEVEILAKMHDLQMYVSVDGVNGNFEKSRKLESLLNERLSIDISLLASIINGMSATGFVSVEQATWANTPANYLLTDLTRFLLDILFHTKIDAGLPPK